MSLFKKKSGEGVFKAPSFDPYKKWQNDGSGLLGFRQDDHVIMPGVTNYEERKLKKVVDYVAKVTEKECTLPQHMINDVYSMYVNEDIKRRPSNPNSDIKHMVLDRVYNSLTKIVTKDSPLFSEILTRELALYMQDIEREIKEEEEKKNGGGSGEGAGEDSEEDKSSPFDIGGEDGEDNGESDDPSGLKAGDGHDMKGHGEWIDKVNEILDRNDKKLEQSFNKADEIIKDLEEKLGPKALSELANENTDFLDKIESIKGALERVSFSRESIKEVLVKILNESQNYFSSKYTNVEESLFESEQFEDLYGLEFLHPIFRMASIMDVGNMTRVYRGKMDLYLDCSGSMGATENFEGQNIRMSDLVKGIAMVMFRLDMIDKLYFFDGGLYEIKNINEFTILGFNKSGGTDFNQVVDQVAANGRNSVVITDGEDTVKKYIKNIFWVGVGGTTFNGYYGGEGAFATYKSMKQCVTYNSNTRKFDYCKKNN